MYASSLTLLHKPSARWRYHHGRVPDVEFSEKLFMKRAADIQTDTASQ
jgi:hypothetical protein